MYNLKNFCNIIASLRRKHGLSQSALAEKIGIAHQSVSKWECGIGYPDVTLFPVLAEIFAVPIGVLFGEEPTEELMNKPTEAYEEFSAVFKNIAVHLGNKCRVEFIEDNSGICRMSAQGDPVFIRYIDTEADGDNQLTVQIKNPCGSQTKWEDYDREGYSGENLVRIHTGGKCNIATVNYLDLTAYSGDNADGNYEVLCR